MLDKSTTQREKHTKLIVTNGSEEHAKCIMRRNAVDEPQLLGKPILLGEAKFLDINPFIGSANQGAERDEENILLLRTLELTKLSYPTVRAIIHLFIKGG